MKFNGSLEVTKTGDSENSVVRKGDLSSITSEFLKQSTQVNCKHAIEITGNTGDEHGLAIEDQQMLLNKIQGQTYTINQLVDNLSIKTKTTYGITITNNGDGSLTLDGTTSDIIYEDLKSFLNCSNHKLLFLPSSFPSDANNIITYYIDTPYTSWKKDNLIRTVSAQNQRLWLFIPSGKTFSNVKITPQLIDLTQMFGSGNEPTTVEEFYSKYNVGYIPYNEGTFEHSQCNLISTSKNLFNQDKVLIEQGFTRQSDGSYYIYDYAVLDKTLWKNRNNYQGRVAIIGSYYHIDKTGFLPKINYKDGSYDYVSWWQDKNKWCTHTQYSAEGKVVDEIVWSASEYTETYVKDIMITTDLNAGEYEPYKEEVVEVGELKQWDYKDNQSGNDVFATGEIDLGDLDWRERYGGFDNIFAVEINDIVSVSSNQYANIKISSNKYNMGKWLDNWITYTIGTTGKTLAIYDNDFNDDATTFKQAMKGVKLIYQLETPTIVENDNLPAGMSVYKGGYQIQEGKVPYILTKEYSLSTKAQVLANIEIDKEQQAQIDHLKTSVAEKTELATNTIITSEQTTTVEVGGISKNTSLKGKTVAEVINAIFFPYVPFKFNTTPLNLTESAGDYEYGDTVTISKVKPLFTSGSDAITSIKIGTTSGGSDLYDGSSATSGENYTISKTFDGTTGGTIYCTLSDGTTTETEDASINYIYHTYYAVTDSTTTPTTWISVGTSSTNNIEIEAKSGQYIWIASDKSYDVSETSDPKDRYGICQINELSGKYNNAANTVKLANQTLVNAHNYTCTQAYNFYRLEVPRASDTKTKFKLGKGE